MMTKEQIAEQLMHHFRWCIYNDFTVHDNVVCLGYTCKTEIVARAEKAWDIKLVLENMVYEAQKLCS